MQWVLPLGVFYIWVMLVYFFFYVRTMTPQSVA